MFRCQEFMSQNQQGIAEGFQKEIEPEYALCVREVIKINQAIANNSSPRTNNWTGVDCANLEIHSIHKYWYNRLDCLINFIATKDYKLNEKLARKYLTRITSEEENATT
jgi:hypothetical protein